MHLLDQIVARKREEVAVRKRAVSLAALRSTPAPATRDLAAALRKPGISLIAEIKRRSPSRGVLRENLDPAALAREYESHGASAISVLTDADFFGGSDDDIIAVRDRTTIPILRKDFTIDEYQIWEARALGASAILLILRILDDVQLSDLLAVAESCGLAVLTEAHNEAEVERALRAGTEIIGVNARDLDTFTTDLETVFRVKRLIPSNCITVAESAIRTRDDVMRTESVGFDAILVGETLVRAEQPGDKLSELLGRD